MTGRAKAKIEISNHTNGFWEIIEISENYVGDISPIFNPILIENIPKDHIAYGWLECIMQSDNYFDWKPKYISMNYQLLR
jgi:hypothetical protein